METNKSQRQRNAVGLMANQNYQYDQTYSKPKHVASQSTGSILMGQTFAMQSKHKLASPVDMLEAKRSSAAPMIQPKPKLLTAQPSTKLSRQQTRQSSGRSTVAPSVMGKPAQTTVNKQKAISYSSNQRSITARLTTTDPRRLASPQGSIGTNIMKTQTMQTKTKSTSCMRNMLATCTSCKDKGSKRAKVSKSPPQPIQPAKQSTKRQMNTEPNSVLSSFKPRLLKQADITQRKRLGSPPAILNQPWKVGSLSSKSKERAKKTNTSTDISLAAQSLRLGQGLMAHQNRNVRQRTTLVRLKTTSGVSNSQGLIEDFEASNTLPNQSLKMCDSPRRGPNNELQSEPFEISPLRSSQKKNNQIDIQQNELNLLASSIAQRLQPNHPVISRMKKPQTSEQQLYENNLQPGGAAMEDTRLTAAYADLSLIISSDFTRSQNQVNQSRKTGTGTEFNGQDDMMIRSYKQYGGIDRSLVLQSSSENDQPMNRKEISIGNDAFGLESRSSDFVIKEVQNQAVSETGSINLAKPLGLVQTNTMRPHQYPTSSTESFMNLAKHLVSQQQSPVVPQQTFKTPDNYCNKHKVTLINKSYEEAKLDRTENMRHSKQQMIKLEPSDLEHQLTAIVPNVQKDPLKSFSNQDQLQVDSNFGSTQNVPALDVESLEPLADRSSNVTIHSCKPKAQTNLNCTVQSNIIDICITSTSEISLANTAKYAKDQSRDQQITKQASQKSKKSSTSTAKPKNSFLQKAALQSSGGSMTFRENESSVSKLTPRRGQQNQKSIIYKSVSRIDIPLSSSRGSGMPSSPVLHSTMSKTVRATASKGKTKNGRANKDNTIDLSNYSRGKMSPLIGSLSNKTDAVMKKSIGLPPSLGSSIVSNRSSNLFKNVKMPVERSPLAKQNNQNPYSTQTGAKSPILNEDIAEEAPSLLMRVSEEQVVIEPDIPIPYTNNSSVVSGVSSVSNATNNRVSMSSGNVMGSITELPHNMKINQLHLPASKISILQHSKSSILTNAPSQNAESNATRTLRKMMTVTPSLAYHKRPTMTKELAGMNTVRHTTDQQVQKEFSRERMSQMSGKASKKRKSGSRNIDKESKKFNPRDTIAYSDAVSSPGTSLQLKSFSSCAHQSKKNTGSRTSLSQNKTPQPRSSKNKNQSQVSKTKLGVGSSFDNQHYQGSQILDIVLNNKPFTAEQAQSLDKLQPKTQKIIKSKVLEIGIDEPLQSKQGDQQVDPPSQDLLSDVQEDQCLIDDKTSAQCQIKVEKAQEQNIAQIPKALNESQNNGSCLIESNRHSVSETAQQAMKQSCGFEKLDQMDGDVNDTESQISLSQMSSQQAFDFSASRAIAATIEANTQQSLDKDQQVVVTKVVKRRSVNRYHSLEDQRDTEPPSQMEIHSFSSLRSDRKVSHQKTRSLSQKKRQLFSKFLTKSDKSVDASQNSRSINLQSARSQEHGMKFDSQADNDSQNMVQEQSLEEVKQMMNGVKKINSNPAVFVHDMSKPSDELEFDAFTPANYPGREDDLSPTKLTSRDNESESRITKDLPAETKISKIFRQVEKSAESNLLDDLSRSLEKNAANLLNCDDLMGSQDLLTDVDNPLMQDDEAIMMDNQNSQILDLLDDPLTLNQLCTPSNKVPPQNNFLTPDVRSNFNMPEEQKMTVVPRHLASMHGSLSVISEEKSMQQESISTGSYAHGNMFMSATMSSAFNSARKHSNAQQTQILMQRNISLMSGDCKLPSSGKREPDSPFSLEQEMMKQQMAGLPMQLNRQQSGDCKPFFANMINELDEIDGMQPLSSRSLQDADAQLQKAYKTETVPKRTIRRVSTDSEMKDFDDNSGVIL